MAQKLETGPLQIQHGHNGTQVLVQFTRMTDHLLLSPKQAEDFVAAMCISIEKLKEHLAKGKN